MFWPLPLKIGVENGASVLRGRDKPHFGPQISDFGHVDPHLDPSVYLMQINITEKPSEAARNSPSRHTVYPPPPPVPHLFTRRKRLSVPFHVTLERSLIASPTRQNHLVAPSYRTTAAGPPLRSPGHWVTGSPSQMSVITGDR